MNARTPLLLASDSVTSARRAEQVVTGRTVTDGDGVRINRVLTQTHQRRLDPFLMLDIFGSDSAADYVGGFPSHPHRGFETVTFMLDGRMRHRDSAGNEGLLEPGGVQWMTAGRGVIHSEMPEQEEGRMEGFQLWLNLPAKEKMCAPWYRDFTAADLVRFETDTGAKVQVIAGTSHGVASVVQREATQVLYLDIELAPGARFSQPLPAGHNAFVCAYRGEVSLGEGAQVGAGETAIGHGQMVILANEGDGVVLESKTGGRAILVAGRPLGEPIVQHGPFVMNTQAEIHQAMADYRDGRLG